MDKIKNKLIDLDTLGKVQLWLTYAKLKPMSTISFGFDWSDNKLANINMVNLASEKLAKDWFELANLSYVFSKRFADTVHVSFDQGVLGHIQDVELSNSQGDHLWRGLNYGFPAKAAEIYASEIVKANPFPNKYLTLASVSEVLKDKYWLPYCEYLLRIGYELEDSQVAKGWADEARREIPSLAKEYELRMLNDMRKQAESLRSNS